MEQCYESPCLWLVDVRKFTDAIRWNLGRRYHRPVITLGKDRFSQSLIAVFTTLSPRDERTEIDLSTCGKEKCTDFEWSRTTYPFVMGRRRIFYIPVFMFQEEFVKFCGSCNSNIVEELRKWSGLK